MANDKKIISINVSTPKQNPMNSVNSPQMPTKEERDNGSKGYETRSGKDGR